MNANIKYNRKSFQVVNSLFNSDLFNSAIDPIILGYGEMDESVSMLAIHCQGIDVVG